MSTFPKRLLSATPSLVPTQYIRRNVLFGPNATPRILNFSDSAFPFTTQPGYLATESSSQKYDFVYGDESTMAREFGSPVQMMNQLMRMTSQGMLETVSPLDAWLNHSSPMFRDTHNRYLTWTDMHTNTLCLLPYCGTPNLVGTAGKSRMEWRDLVAFEPTFLKNYFIWTHPLEWNLRLYTYETEEEYELLFTEGIRQASDYTRMMLEHYGKTAHQNGEKL